LIHFIENTTIPWRSRKSINFGLVERTRKDATLNRLIVGITRRTSRAVRSGEKESEKNL